MKTRRWSIPVALTVAIAAAAPAAVAAAPAVRVSARPLATSLSTRATKTTITVRNGGRERVGGLSLSVASARGVTVVLAGARRGRLSRTLPVLRAGRSVRVSVSLKRRRGGPSSGGLVVRVLHRDASVATARLAFGPSRTRTGPRPTAPPQLRVVPNTLAGRYFWGSIYTLSGIEQHTLWFTGPNLVYNDDAEGAVPACAAVTEDCKPYAYDSRANALTIDGKPATLDRRTLSFDDDTYFEFGFPPAGTRLDAHLTYSNSSGICPLYCSYFTEDLTFIPDGTFLRDALSSGSGPVVDWASVPPESKGTYEIRADHTIRMLFGDDRERIETIGLYMNDDGTLRPPGEGVILDGDGYFDIRD